jgi:3D (Asp-Asp-Asp) domain-containing protein
MTAYVPEEGSRTATGRNANLHPGIAADFKMFPPGTKIYIPGKGSFPVDDTGGAMRRDAKKGIRHIDLRIIPHYRNADPDAAYDAAVRYANTVIERHWINAYVLYPPHVGHRG